MNYLLASLNYVTTDQFFWLAMGMTTVLGLFIGAVVYDGVIKDVKKVVIVLLSYVSILSFTNYARILPIIIKDGIHEQNQPLAGIVTILLVTFFYLLGMILGVFITNKAHKGNEK